jgi:hypothetical protein
MNGSNNSFSFIPTLSVNNKPVLKNKEKAEALAEVYANASATSNYSAEFQAHKNSFERNNKTDYSDESNESERRNPLNHPFSKTELFNAIKSCNNNKTAGPDNIPYELLRNCQSRF